MLKIINKSLAFCLAVFFCGLATQVSVFAAESGGGQVSSNSRISFYSDEPEKEKPEPTPKPEPKPKPGNLPQAGEAVKSYFFLGLLIVISTMFLFIRKKRGRKDEQT